MIHRSRRAGRRRASGLLNAAVSPAAAVMVTDSHGSAQGWRGNVDRVVDRGYAATAPPNLRFGVAAQELTADPQGLLADTQPSVHPRPGRLPHPSHADGATQPIFEARNLRNPNWTLQPRQP